MTLTRRDFLKMSGLFAVWTTLAERCNHPNLPVT
ncbi:MAG: twin-arginine translocation signal domain-containing protein [Anaerolineaceae bacterium]|jgi:hypothetical protein|nr:twin-arginine translocation signal domain-containing protein [Anaerolineaceae bacterium]OQY88043.1 MAG: hypothetical protein B6D38_10790 [Anaerolineae bacterium UTCFX1]